MNMKLLEKIKIFSGLNKFDRYKLLHNFITEPFTDGTKIVEEGSVGTKFYIVKYGSVRVFAHKKEIGELYQGAYFGQNSLTRRNLMDITGKIHN